MKGIPKSCLWAILVSQEQCETRMCTRPGSELPHRDVQVPCQLDGSEKGQDRGAGKAARIAALYHHDGILAGQQPGIRPEAVLQGFASDQVLPVDIGWLSQ